MLRVRPKTSSSEQPVRFSFAVLATALSIASCQTSTTSPLAPGAPLSAESAFASQVEVVAIEGRPTLAVVKREGDPSPVLAVVLHADSQDQAAIAGFAELVLSALRSADVTARARVDRTTIVLDLDAPAEEKASVRRAIQALDGVLRAPIQVKDAPSVQKALTERLANIPREPHRIASRARTCLGQAGFDADQPAQRDTLDLGTPQGVERLEAVRSQLALRSAVTFAVVGPQSARELVEAAIKATAEWRDDAPAHAPTFRPTSSAEGAAFNVSGNTARVTLAAPTTDPTAAVAAAEALGASPSPLGARAMRRGFRVLRTVGVARPDGGGCVSVTLEGLPPGSQTDADTRSFAEAVDEVTAASLHEMQVEIARGGKRVDMPARIIRAESARESAQLAAWWARSHPLADKLDENDGLAVAVAVPPDVSTAPDSSLAHAVTSGMGTSLARENEEAKSKVARVVTRLERGQAQSWVLVVNPCAPVEEPAHRWGISALAALAATPKARAAARSSDVEVEPFIGSGVGFIAHASPRSTAELPEELVRRVARAALASFFVEPPTGDELLFAEEAALDRLTRRWSRDAPGLVALTRATNNPPLPDHPTLLEPFGLPNRVARFESGDLTRRLRALTDGPLSIAILARDDASDEEAAARSEIVRWLGPGPRTSCKGVAPYSHRGARVEVRESRKGPVVLRILLPLDTTTARASERARIVTALLGGSEGLLAKAVSAGPNMRVEAQLAESAATLQLVLTVVGSEETVVAAEPLALDLLQRLSRGELPDGVLAAGIVAHDAWMESESTDPRKRLSLALEADEREPHAALAPADVRDYLKKAIVPNEAFIVLARPDS